MRRIAIAALLLSFTCIVTPVHAQTRATQAATAPTTQAASETKFMRFVKDGNGYGRLEAAVVTYKNSAGARVDLIAAVHVADAGFYKSLDESFADYDSLLYEMVKPKDADAPVAGQRSGSWVSSLQTGMKSVLHLEFQLDGIDYHRANFVHADLDAETFEKMQADRGESILGLMLKQALHNVGKTPAAGSTPPPDLMTLLFAMKTPEGARALKMMLAEQFGNLDDMMGGQDLGDDNGKGTVLVTERNKAAVAVLDKQLEKGDKRLGIFYGAAHLRGMEKMLVERGFKKVGVPAWRTCWDMSANADVDAENADVPAPTSTKKPARPTKHTTQE